jgi:ubiquinone/menaquinone biosynthesis C-methylase UbiE
MISEALLQIIRCPTCRGNGLLEADGEVLHCAHCGERYPRGPGYLDLLPRGAAFDHTTHYVADEEAFAEALDYQTVGPPLLAAGVRQRILQQMLQLDPSDRVIDCGCGNGKFALWNHEAVALLVGLDPATLFADAALAEVDLVQGDARRMPFATASFDKAFTIDVFEHLTLPDMKATLDELHRLLRPGGRLLIYSNTREPSSLEPIVNLWRRIGRFLRHRRPDPDPDALRKADHIKAVATYEELQSLVEGHGFRIVEVRFWNSVVTSFVEHVLTPLLTTTPLPTPPSPDHLPVDGGDQGEPERGGRAALRQRAAKRGLLYWGARALTWWMGWDMTLFSRLRSGSYFLLLERPEERSKQPGTS